MSLTNNIPSTSRIEWASKDPDKNKQVGNKAVINVGMKAASDIIVGNWVLKADRTWAKVTAVSSNTDVSLKKGTLNNGVTFTFNGADSLSVGDSVTCPNNVSVEVTAIEDIANGNTVTITTEGNVGFEVENVIFG